MEVSNEIVGRRSRPYMVELDARRTMNFAAGTLDTNPAFFDDEREGGVIAPAMLATALSWDMVQHRERFWDSRDFPPEVAARQVHYTEVLQMHQPLRPGQSLAVQAEVVAMLPHRAGTHMIVRYEATANGEPVFTEYSGAMLRDVQLVGEGRGKEHVHELERPPRQDAPDWEKTIHVHPLAAYFYDGHNPIHTSAAFAKAVSLPGAIVHGAATLAYAVREIVEAEAGGDPSRVAAIHAHFTGMVLPDTDIRITLSARHRVDDLTHCHFLVWNAENKRAIRNACVSLRD
jgi:acyl dehydratase